MWNFQMLASSVDLMNTRVALTRWQRFHRTLEEVNSDVSDARRFGLLAVVAVDVLSARPASPANLPTGWRRHSMNDEQGGPWPSSAICTVDLSLRHLSTELEQASWVASRMRLAAGHVAKPPDLSVAGAREE